MLFLKYAICADTSSIAAKSSSPATNSSFTTVQRTTASYAAYPTCV